MEIRIENAGKKFYSEWIYRNINITLGEADSLAILGANGSGKSTLLQMLAGMLTPNEGTVTHYIDHKKLERTEVFKYISFASPYLELIEEFTLEEIVQTHFRFKKPLMNLTTNEIISTTGLTNSSQKVFKYFSSGMKQRVKLTLALLSHVPLLLLDEPGSNLDKNAVHWYRELIEKYSKGRIVIICSNHLAEEYDFCKRVINMEDYKGIKA